MDDKRVTSVSQGFRRLFSENKSELVLILGFVAVLMMLYFVITVSGLSEQMGDWFRYVLYVIPAPLILYLRRLSRLSRVLFWKHFAQDHGLHYEKNGDASKEQAAMFHRHVPPNIFSSSSAIIENVVSGTVNGRSARVFELRFARGSEKESEWHYFTVVEFRMYGRFPHIFLNRIDAGFFDVISGHKRIYVSDAFAQHFELVAAQKYEQEALEIFTPDVIDALLALEHPHDVELVDRELLIFRPGYVQDRVELEQEFVIATRLLELLAPRLDRADYVKIGDLGDSLR